MTHRAAEIFRQYDIRGIVGATSPAERRTRSAARTRRTCASKGVSRRRSPSAATTGRAAATLRDALVAGSRSPASTSSTSASCRRRSSTGRCTISTSPAASRSPARTIRPSTTASSCRSAPRRLHGDEIQELYRLAHDGDRSRPGKGERARRSRSSTATSTTSSTRIGQLARPMKVVYDCGNGAGALVAPQLFERLGVRVDAACSARATARFPNHHPDPTVPENLEDLIAAVKRDGAEIGIAFDGDADRIGVVDERGEIIWGDHMLILYARDVLARTGKGQPIIFDVKCSQALPDAIAKAGGKPVMWKTGHSLIKDKMKELARADRRRDVGAHVLHRGLLRPRRRAVRRRAAAAHRRRLRQDASRELLADVPEFVSTPEIRIDVPEERKFGIVDEAVAHFRATHDVIDVDGVRVLFGDGWGLIRASNTQPVLVLRFEARTRGAARRDPRRDGGLAARAGRAPS